MPDTIYTPGVSNRIKDHGPLWTGHLWIQSTLALSPGSWGCGEQDLMLPSRPDVTTECSTVGREYFVCLDTGWVPLDWEYHPTVGVGKQFRVLQMIIWTGRLPNRFNKTERESMSKHWLTNDLISRLVESRQDSAIESIFPSTLSS